MNILKSLLLILLFLTTTQGFSQYTEVINSNRPGHSQSAFSVGNNVTQFEMGASYLREKRIPATAYKVSGFGVDFAVRYGLFLEELEINFEGNYQNDKKTTYSSSSSSKDSRSNFTYLTVGAKYLVYDPLKNRPTEKPNVYSWKENRRFKWNVLIPAVAIYLGGNLDTANNPYTATGIEGFSPKVTIATQNNFKGWVFVMNFTKDRIGTDQSDFEYILTLTHAVSADWAIFGETQGIKSDFYADNLFSLGAAYLWNKNFQLDTAITFNTKDTPAIFNVNFGASYRLDFHKDPEPKKETTEPEIPEDPNGNSGKKKKKKKKKNDDSELEPEPTEKRQKEDVDFE